METNTSCIGHRRWAIAEGYIPAWSNGPSPEMQSHETCCVLTAGSTDAHVTLTLYFEDRDPVGPYRVTVPARRTRHLRFNEPEVGLLAIKTLGSVDAVLKHDAKMAALAQTDWYAREVILHLARTLRRLDVTARSLFALVEPGSCFAGSLLETALSADRIVTRAGAAPSQAG